MVARICCVLNFCVLSEESIAKRTLLLKKIPQSVFITGSIACTISAKVKNIVAMQLNLK